MDKGSRTALVTGAGVRIGRATALALADAGFNVIVHYRRSEREASELCGAIASRGVRAWMLQADFDAPGEGGGDGLEEKLIDRAVGCSGSLELLVNNASTFPKDDLDSLTLAGLQTNLRVNAWAPFALSRAFARRVGRGRIVNLLDSRIVDADWTHVGYILSKHVLAALTRMTALAYAPDITVNGVAPGLILPPPGAPHEFLDERVGTVPLKRHGMAEEIARAVVFLAESEFVTGEVIFVDGGRHLQEYRRG